MYHPLSPFMNRWFYGDTIFIIEPWLWIVAATALLRNASRRATRVALTTILVLAIGLSWIVPQVSRPAAMLLTAGAALGLLITQRAGGRTATAVGLGGWITVTTCFLLGTSLIRASVTRAAPFDSPRAGLPNAGTLPFTLYDVIVSPIAANPVCARVITVDAQRDAVSPHHGVRVGGAGARQR
ncbi:MAG: hypothetical protein U5K74_11705 [Gemmatimonadaceae bacterium]|nr:hypothetical protein [Gemmatimonadaceae bacterium]